MPTAPEVCDRCGALVATTHWGIHLDYHRRIDAGQRPTRRGHGD